MKRTPIRHPGPGRPIEELSGKQFGKLLVLELAEKPWKGKSAEWICECNCGELPTVPASSLKSGHTTSCGCHSREASRERFLDHGGSKSSTYQAWINAKSRCFNENNPSYRNYGGRGIGMCANWRKSFTAFREDMGEQPTGLTIDRRDNDGGYWCGHCPECVRNEWPPNVRWVDWKVQANNRRPRNSHRTLENAADQSA